MDRSDELVILRLIHILPGIFWVGSVWFIASILDVALRRLGPQHQGPVMGALGRLTVPIFTVSGVTTIAVGFVLVERTPGRGFDQLFDTGWGWMIGIGMLAGLAALAAGVFTGLTFRRMGAAAAAAAGGPPPPAALLLAQRLRLLGRTTAALTLVAVATMAAARFA